MGYEDSNGCVACPKICSNGNYLDLDQCGTSGFETSDGCIACDTTCQAGEYLDLSRCGTLGFETANSCKTCADANCPTGTYYNELKCGTAGFEDKDGCIVPATLDFEDLTNNGVTGFSLPAPYHGLVFDSGWKYFNENTFGAPYDYGAASGNMAIFNAYGTPYSIYKSPSRFRVYSLWLTVTHVSTLNIQIDGKRDGSVVSVTVSAQQYVPTKFVLPNTFANLDELRLTPIASHEYTIFALDDITVDFE